MQKSIVNKGVTGKKKFSLTDPKIVPYVFVAPFLFYFLLVYFYPIIRTILMSFQDKNGNWYGFGNYERLNSAGFIMALKTSGRYALWDVIVLTIIPLLLATLLHSGLVKGTNFFKSLLFIPSLTSIIVAGIVFRLAFGDLDTAVANQVVSFFGGTTRKWLKYADTGNLVLILLTLWRWMGVNIVYYLSGLQTIPSDLYEAAQIDGANAIKKFFYVTLPGLKPVTIYVITITVLGGFSMFTESVALWQQKNPGDVGRTIVGYLYLIGFDRHNFGMASTVGLALLGLVLVVNFLQLILMGFFKKED